MGQKQKGTNAERELVHMFWKTGSWAAHRIAGSGSSRYPSPDIIASNNIRRLAIEVKSTKRSTLYIPKDEVDALLSFSRMFGAEPWIAVRFVRTDWLFLSTDDLKATAGNYSTSQGNAKEKGLLFEELTDGLAY